MESCGTFFLTNNNNSFYDLSYFFDYFLLNPGLFIHYFFSRGVSQDNNCNTSDFFFHNNSFFNQNFLSQLNNSSPRRPDQLHIFINKKHNKSVLTNYCFYKYVHKPLCNKFYFLESDHFFVFREGCLPVSLPDFSNKSLLKE